MKALVINQRLFISEQFLISYIIYFLQRKSLMGLTKINIVKNIIISE
ncbi:hypothetical protein H1P_150015 [Hyella patelloides LEGE 07179]|uniref:Uncharacterized protein n=1 Tax=Hyella patelloides LEGE 07179 TaxID=945734 RepID=A0A563VM07_9CYAN|nr:hypothetical protein H1P_150015 [Hyella patelloides LEGE 07179]